MPKTLIALPDVYETVTRRVAVALTSQLAQTMRLPGDTLVYLPGATDTIPMNGGTFGDCYDTGVRYPAESSLTVRYTEEVDEGTTLTTPVQKHTIGPIWRDAPRDIDVRPVYRQVRLQATFEYKAPNITLARRWVDEMRSRISMGRAELYHDIEFHYGVPRPLTELLRHLHETREASESPTGESFEDYYQDHFTVPRKVVSTLTGTEEMDVIPEHQYEMLGWFDFTTTPQEPERSSNEDGTYVSTITYTLYYDRPMQVYCEYPMLIHNRPVSKRYRPQEPYSTFRKVTRRVSATKGSYDAFLEELAMRGVPYIQYPDYDDWIPASIPDNQLTFFTGLMVISPSDPHTLVNLAQLGDMEFTPFFLEYFYHQRDRLFNNQTSIFQFRVYENRTLMSGLGLTLDETLTLRSTKALDPTKYYHIQISLQRRWVALDQDVLQCLRRYPTVMYWSLRALGIYLEGVDDPGDLKLIAPNYPRLPKEECPGEGSTIGPPDGPGSGWGSWPGGQWPWPWLGDEWDDVPYPGYDYCGWTDTPWPYLNPGYCDMDDTGSNPPWPGSVVLPGGTVGGGSLEDILEETEEKLGHPVDRIVVGPMNVLFAEIITHKTLR